MCSRQLVILFWSLGNYPVLWRWWFIQLCISELYGGRWSAQLHHWPRWELLKHPQSPPTSWWPIGERHMKESRDLTGVQNQIWMEHESMQEEEESISFPEVLQRRNGFQHCPSEPPPGGSEELWSWPPSHPHKAQDELQDQDGTHVV